MEWARDSRGLAVAAGDPERGAEPGGSGVAQLGGAGQIGGRVQTIERKAQGIHGYGPWHHGVGVRERLCELVWTRKRGDEYDPCGARVALDLGQQPRAARI